MTFGAQQNVSIRVYVWFVKNRIQQGDNLVHDKDYVTILLKI